VEGEHGHLDGESQAERQEEPGLQARVEDHARLVEDVERIRPRRLEEQRGEGEDGGQHQQAAGHREQDELHGGINAPLAAPDADQEIHGDQGRFPEHVEEEQVERKEDAQDARLQEEHENEVFLDPIANVAPGGEEDDRQEERREQHEEKADPVDADMVLNAVAQPGRFFDELRPGGRRVEPEIEEKRCGEDDERQGQGEPVQQAFSVPGKEDEQDGPGQREEYDQAQEGHGHGLKTGALPG
jgi:hypothetical protein